MSTTPVAPTTPTTRRRRTGLPTGQSLNNMFLQLLVAQLQNQDPTSPVDPSQFVGQLAQFSELSEVTSIYTLLQAVRSGIGEHGVERRDRAGELDSAANAAAASPAVSAAARPALAGDFSCRVASPAHFPSVTQLPSPALIGTNQQDPRSVLNA